AMSPAAPTVGPDTANPGRASPDRANPERGTHRNSQHRGDSMGRYDGRVVLITGAARGIGFGCAQRFAAEGAAVALVDLDEQSAADAASRIASEGQTKAIGIGCDVSDADSAAAAVERAVAELGGLHVLVNN